MASLPEVSINWLMTFSIVSVGDRTLPYHLPQYWMLHKPVGVVSATRDEQHPTVISLMPAEADPELHIAGRLDLNSSGLLLLTNDSRWSSRLSDPLHEVPKSTMSPWPNPCMRRISQPLQRAFILAMKTFIPAQPLSVFFLNTSRDHPYRRTLSSNRECWVVFVIRYWRSSAFRLVG